MKIAVYSIALNEEKHVERWFESAKAADLVLIADTGSTDKTVELALSLGISVHRIVIDPWRFDTARNASLALIPSDIDLCIQLDLDELLPSGWRPVVEEAWHAGNIWPIYKHVTSRFEDGTARSYQNYFKIHPRKGFTWKYPIHEIVVPEDGAQIQRLPIDLEVDHIKDETKSRSSYLNLLEKAVQELPGDWRMNHYLNREYFYNKDWVKVISSAYATIAIDGGWDVERASTLMWASEAALSLKFDPLAEDFANRATAAAPHFYEAWHWRAQIAHLQSKWQETFDYASKIFELERQQHHLVRPGVWEWWGYDLVALSSYHLGRFQDAVRYGEIANQNNPQNERLAKNLEYYRAAANQP